MPGDERYQLMEEVTLAPVLAADQEEFLCMAQCHFQELNPGFVPQDDWKSFYFQSIVRNPKMRLEWIMWAGRRAGFILSGLEQHRFLPRQSGMIYELYVEPAFRRKGLARASAREVIRRLKEERPSKLQLEIMGGNVGAELLWKSFGFKKVCERWVQEESEF